MGGPAHPSFTPPQKGREMSRWGCTPVRAAHADPGVDHVSLPLLITSSDDRLRLSNACRRAIHREVWVVAELRR